MWAEEALGCTWGLSAQSRHVFFINWASQHLPAASPGCELEQLAGEVSVEAAWPRTGTLDSSQLREIGL